MSLIPNTTCSRCHRQYPAIKGRCPYCGTRKPRQVQRTLPEADSAVKGTEAARRAAENVNWQMLIGGILLLAILIAVISLVSVNVKKHVEDTSTAEEEEVIPEIEVAATAPPTATPVPTPSPTPAPTVTAVTIYFMGQEETGFMEGAGTQVQLTAQWYPTTVEADVVWASSDESVATVDDTGLVTVVSTNRNSTCNITATVGGVTAVCQVWSAG
jgi:hypothetical protein